MSARYFFDFLLAIVKGRLRPEWNEWLSDWIKTGIFHCHRKPTHIFGQYVFRRRELSEDRKGCHASCLFAIPLPTAVQNGVSKSSEYLSRVTFSLLRGISVKLGR